MFWNSLVGNSFTSWNYWKKSKKNLDSRTGVKKGLEPFSTSPWLLELESRRTWNIPVQLLDYWNGVKGLEPSSSTSWLLELVSRVWNLPVQLLDYWNWSQEGLGTFQFNSLTIGTGVKGLEPSSSTPSQPRTSWWGFPSPCSLSSSRETSCTTWKAYIRSL